MEMTQILMLLVRQLPEPQDPPQKLKDPKWEVLRQNQVTHHHQDLSLLLRHHHQGLRVHPKEVK